MEYILAHDFGTSSAKAALFTVNGDVVRDNTYNYPTYRSHGNWVEQDAEDWWKSFCENNKVLLEGIPKEDVICVSFDGTVPDMLCVDKELKPLHKALIWQDNRAIEEAEEIAAKIPDHLKEGRGSLGPARGMMMLMWIRKHWPEVYEKTDKIIISNSLYVIAKLIGKAVTDRELAFGTAMMKPDFSDWQEEILEIADFPRSILPELHDRVDVVGEVPANLADECGLAAGTKIVVGETDGGCNRLGSGVYKPCDGNLNAGTSGGVGGWTPDGKDPKVRGTSAAGASMDWLKNVFCIPEQQEAEETGRDVYTIINEKIMQSPVGANGVMFHPYLSGERGVRNNPNTRGSFVGISLSTTREDIMRSVVEGNAYNLNLLVEQARSKGLPFTRVPFIGGMSKGAAVRQIFADVMNTELMILERPDLSAVVGAAVLGGIGVGVFDDLSACEKFVKHIDIVKPNAENHAKYESLKPLFEEVYNAQLPLYEKFAKE